MKHEPAPPLTRALTGADALASLDALADLPHAFLLHSALPSARARWSFFGADPFAWFEGADYDNAVARWRELAARTRGTLAPTPPPAPFTGGAVGSWAYDFGRRLERLPARARDDLGLPDVALGFYDVVGAIDHASGTASLYSSGLPLEGRE
jgi:para-aminobenzoate synthetase component 1